MFNAERFFDRGIAILPVNGKRPFTKDWYSVDFSDKIEKFRNKNIGLKCGKASGIIALDFDSINPKVKEEVQKLLPPIFSGKVGNPSKLPTMFFSFDGQVSRDLKAIELQLLSTGKQTVIPPSIHPDYDTPFMWSNKSLLDIDIDELPTLTDDLWDSLVKLNDQFETSVSPGVQKTAGRNNSLKEQASAGLANDQDIEELLEQLINYDSLNHSPPLFSDSSEPYMNRSVYHNAKSFVFRIGSSLSRSKKVEFEKPDNQVVVIEDVVNNDEVDDVDDGKLDYKKHKYPKLRGIGDEMFKYLYKSAPIPRSKWAFASTLFTVSTLIGNRVSFNGTYPNLFVMLIGKSGFGKDAYQRFPTDLLVQAGAEHYIGEGQPSSDSSILNNLTDYKVRADVIDEADTLFKSMRSQHSFNQNLANCYQKLYTSCGGYFQGKSAMSFVSKSCPDGRLGTCHSPYVNLMCTLNIGDFQDSFNSSLMDKGLGGRFMYFVDDKPKPNQFPDRSTKQIPSSVIEFAQANIIPNSHDEDIPILGSPAIEMTLDSRLQKPLKDMLIHFDQLKLKCQNDKTRPVMNRLAQQFLKFAIIDARCRGLMSIDRSALDWAHNLASSYIHNMDLFLTHNLAFNDNDFKEMIYCDVIQGAGKGGISMTDFSKEAEIRRLGLPSQIRKKLVESLIENGDVLQAKDGRKKMLYHSKFYKNHSK